MSTDTIDPGTGPGTDEATAELNVGTDASLFDGALADSPADTSVGEKQAADSGTQDGTSADGTQPRDVQGRFASKQTEQPAAAGAAGTTGAAATTTAGTTSTADEPAHRVPLAEHLSVRERAQNAERERDDLRNRLQAFERMQRAPQQEPKEQETPDPILNPKEFIAAMRNEFTQQLANERRDISLGFAARTYKEEFPEAYKAAQTAIASGDNALTARLHTSADPGETLIQWHREQKTMREVGGDMAAYRQKLLDDALKDPAYLSKAIEAARVAAAGGTTNGSAAGTTNGSANGASNGSTTATNGARTPNVQLPPSLSRATSAGSHAGTAPGELDMTDAGLFEFATRP